jgi:hypothetical protein
MSRASRTVRLLSIACSTSDASWPARWAEDSSTTIAPGLTEAGITRIREQLKSINAALAARGIPAGGERALRLFS